MAEHALAQSVSDVYIRFYTKPSAGYAFGAEKVLTVNKTLGGGIYWGNLHFNLGTGSASSSGSLWWQAVSPGTSKNTGFSLTGGRWYFIELHMNVATGVLQVWADDCGVDGTTCPATPTLRLNVTGFAYPSSGQVGAVWFENWANPGSSGTRLLDQIMVSRVGPIGFMR